MAKKQNKKTIKATTESNDVWNPWEPDKFPVKFAVDEVEPKFFAVESGKFKGTAKGVVEGNPGETYDGVDVLQYAKYINPYNPADLPTLELIGVTMPSPSGMLGIG